MYATMACLVRHAGHEDGSRMVINRKPRRAVKMQDYSETRLHAGVDKRRSETHNLNRLPRDWTTLKLSSPTSEVSYIHYYYCLHSLLPTRDSKLLLASFTYDSFRPLCGAHSLLFLAIRVIVCDNHSQSHCCRTTRHSLILHEPLRFDFSVLKLCCSAIATSNPASAFGPPTPNKKISTTDLNIADKTQTHSLSKLLGAGH